MLISCSTPCNCYPLHYAVAASNIVPAASVCHTYTVGFAAHVSVCGFNGPFQRSTIMNHTSSAHSCTFYLIYYTAVQTTGPAEFVPPTADMWFSLGSGPLSNRRRSGVPAIPSPLSQQVTVTLVYIALPGEGETDICVNVGWVMFLLGGACRHFYTLAHIHSVRIYRSHWGVCGRIPDYARVR